MARLYGSLLRQNRSRARVDPILEVLGGAAVALVLGLAGWRAANGGSTLGNFTGFVAALLLASRPVRSLGALNAAVQEGMAGLIRVFSVVDEKPTILDHPGAQNLPAGPGFLQFEEVHFVYPDGRAGLDGLSFAAAPGRTVALVGASGAGKSTALTLIPRLKEVSDGRILLDGADIRDVTLASLRDAIAYVGQDIMLFDDTVGANIAMGRPDASDEAIWSAAQAAAADETSSAPCLTACRPMWAPAAHCSPEASGSVWRWPGRCCAIRAFCCSTRRPVRSMRRARRRCSWR